MHFCMHNRLAAGPSPHDHVLLLVLVDDQVCLPAGRSPSSTGCSCLVAGSYSQVIYHPCCCEQPAPHHHDTICHNMSPADLHPHMLRAMGCCAVWAQREKTNLIALMHAARERIAPEDDFFADPNVLGDEAKLLAAVRQAGFKECQCRQPPRCLVCSSSFVVTHLPCTVPALVARYSAGCPAQPW